MVYHLRNRHKDCVITCLISLFMHRRPRTVFRGCKSQFKNAGFGQNKNVGFPTFLFCLFPTLLFYPLQLKQITVWEDHFTVALKSGLKIDIED